MTVLEAQGKHFIYLKTSAEPIDLGSYIIRIGTSQSSSVLSCLLPALVFFDFHGNACISIFFSTHPTHCICCRILVSHICIQPDEKTIIFQCLKHIQGQNAAISSSEEIITTLCKYECLSFCVAFEWMVTFFQFFLHISYLALSSKQMNNGGFCLGVQGSVGFVNAFLLLPAFGCRIVPRAAAERWCRSLQT